MQVSPSLILGLSLLAIIILYATLIQVVAWWHSILGRSDE